MNLGHTVPELLAAGDLCGNTVSTEGQTVLGDGHDEDYEGDHVSTILARSLLMQPELRALITFGTG